MIFKIRVAPQKIFIINFVIAILAEVVPCNINIVPNTVDLYFIPCVQSIYTVYFNCSADTYAVKAE